MKANNNILINLEEYVLDSKIKYSMDSNHIFTVILDVFLLDQKVNIIPEKGIIKTYANNREDYWVISNIDKDLDIIELTCRHIVTEYMLSTFVADSKPRLLNCNDMLNHLKQNSESYLKGRQYAKDLETYSNLNAKDYKNKNIWRKNFYDTVNELQKLFGGEIRKEGFEIGLVDHVGSKKSVYSIEYGKNLISNTSEEDLDIIIGICPKGYDKLYTNTIVYSPKVASNPNILGRIEEIEYPIRLIEHDENGEEVGERDGNYQYYDNEEDAKNELIRLAGLEFTQNHVDEPKISFDTTLLDLSLVEECKDLDKIYLSIGDTVSTSIPKFNLNIETRVIELEVDVLADEVTNITLSNNSINQLKPPSLNYAIEQLTKTEAKFESVISDKVLGLNSTISQTADKILLKVEDTKKELETSITQTTEDIRLEVKNVKDGLESSISQTVEDIRLEVKNVKDDLQSSIDINADAITQKVSNSDFEAYQKIIAKEIVSKVNSGDLSTIVTQNATSWGLSINGKLKGTNYNFDGNNFTIGSLNDASKAYHASTYSRWNHSDGTSYTQIGSTGLIVQNGMIQIKNKDGTTVLKGDSNGNLTMNVKGSFTMGDTSVENSAYHSSTSSRWNHTDGSYTRINSNGLLIKNGKITIQNNNGVNVLESDSNGNLKLNVKGSFTIGSTSDTNSAYHTATSSRWNHTDGSYTKISSTGLRRYDGGTSKTYHYYIKQGTVLMNDGDQKYISVPDEILSKKGVVIAIEQLMSPHSNNYIYSLNTVLITPFYYSGELMLQATIKWNNLNTKQVEYGGFAYVHYLIVG